MQIHDILSQLFDSKSTRPINILFDEKFDLYRDFILSFFVRVWSHDNFFIIVYDLSIPEQVDALIRAISSELWQQKIIYLVKGYGDNKSVIVKKGLLERYQGSAFIVLVDYKTDHSNQQEWCQNISIPFFWTLKQIASLKKIKSPLVCGVDRLLQLLQINHMTEIEFHKCVELLPYMSVVGQSMIEEFRQCWLSIICHGTHSLFDLSQLFFAKDRAFFAMWVVIRPKYNDLFWVSFWSDQLWRAYHYCIYKSLGDHIQAKQIGLRMPFAFLNHDWKLHTPELLKLLHAQLYNVDCALKQQDASLQLDAWLFEYFHNQLRVGRSG